MPDPPWWIGYVRLAEKHHGWPWELYNGPENRWFWSDRMALLANVDYAVAQKKAGRTSANDRGSPG